MTKDDALLLLELDGYRIAKSSRHRSREKQFAVDLHAAFQSISLVRKSAALQQKKASTKKGVGGA